MKNRKILRLIIPDTKVYLIIILILDILLFVENYVLGLLGLVLFIVLFIHNFRSSRDNLKKWSKYLENLGEEIDSASRNAFINLPIPLSLVELDGKLIWYNSKFSELFNQKELLDTNISKLVPQIESERLLVDDLSETSIKLGDRYYNVVKNFVKMDGDGNQGKYIAILYWIDRTNYIKLKAQYEEERNVIGMIQIDNYEDVLSSAKEDKIPFIISEIDSKINAWAMRMNGLIKKYQSDKYLVVFESKYLENIETKKFSLLDEIREIDAGNKFPITLSIGVSTSNKSLSETEQNAYSALELALGRGGDQAVVKKSGNIDFYGGRSKAVEKRTKVKARVIAHALRTLFNESDKVFIMGHRFPDMDSYGAAIGIHRAAVNRGKEVFFIIDHISPAIADIHTNFEDDKEYNIITPEKALALIKEDDLLVIVDTQRPSYTACPDAIKIAEKIVVLDHHRRGTESIENYSLGYLEPYASSTCELVTEVLQYIEDKITLQQKEAEALLAGIIVDTKSFSFKTGVRTFEAASLLKRFGADTLNVKQLFEDDFETFITKSHVIGNAERFREDIAVAVLDEVLPMSQVIAAQSADELLDIKGIKTSFVLGRLAEGSVFISARSLGDVNVQIILEKLGGGGHMTTAGAQFEDSTIEEVKQRLFRAIDEYFEEV